MLPSVFFFIIDNEFDGYILFVPTGGGLSEGSFLVNASDSVSYTHLDVYKRQPIRSASQKQSSELPALPQNAELIVQKQRQKQLQENLDKLQINDNDSNNNVNTVVDDMNNDNSDHYLSVPKSRKLHPSARAKSVGHARRESLKFTRPPIPAALPPSDMTNDNGFLGEANHDRYNPVSSNFSAVPEDSTTYSDNTIVSTNNGSLSAYSQELTEKQILEEASKLSLIHI